MPQVACMPYFLCQVFNFATHSHSLMTKLSPDIHHSEEGKSIQTGLEVASFCMSYQSRNLISIQADESTCRALLSCFLGLPCSSIFFHFLRCTSPWPGSYFLCVQQNLSLSIIKINSPYSNPVTPLKQRLELLLLRGKPGLVEIEALDIYQQGSNMLSISQKTSSYH